MSNRFVQFDELGSPKVLKVSTEAIPKATGENIVVKNEAIGFNFIDTYFRRGIYEVPLPYRPGGEGAGTIHEIGPDVPKDAGFKVGDRVVYLGQKAYADYTSVTSQRVALLPEGISPEIAAGSLLKGLTVRYLVEKIYTPKKDEIVLYHAGAGGVGLIFLQWAARKYGAKVITTVSTDKKVDIAKANGAWQVLKYTDDIPKKVAELTNGKKVNVVYDSVGKDTWEGSLDSLAKRGLIVSFGNASGKVSPVDLSVLSDKGSLFLTRPTLTGYIDSAEDFRQQVHDFYSLVKDGTLNIEVGRTYKLDDIQQLHTDAESRSTTGSSLVKP